MSLDRYARNMTALSGEENELLRGARVCVVGCGGLGGYAVETLGRLGVGTITAIDGDVFDETNLNRQLYSDTQALGKSKAAAAKRRMALVNPGIRVNAVEAFINEHNAGDLLCGHGVIVDAVDSIAAKLMIQDAAQKLKIPFVHGAAAGWYGQVTTVFPGDRTLDRVYRHRDADGAEKALGTLSFTPALVAAAQAAEAVKVLTGRGALLRGRMLFFDLLDQEYQIVEF
jgi:molybdopterin/thiamine biosynthesis adenylyltransferase